jgi:hypothetical protein
MFSNFNWHNVNKLEMAFGRFALYIFTKFSILCKRRLSSIDVPSVTYCQAFDEI